MASDRGVVGDDGGWIVVGRVLIETLVRSVVVEMVRVAVEDRAGVSLVVDQQSVGAFVADAANKPFGCTDPKSRFRSVICCFVEGQAARWYSLITPPSMRWHRIRPSLGRAASWCSSLGAH